MMYGDEIGDIDIRRKEDFRLIYGVPLIKL